MSQSEAGGDTYYLCQCGCGKQFVSRSKRDTLCDDCRATAGGGVQHVSDAAAPAFIEDLSAWETHADAERVAQRIGVVVRTVAEWQEMEQQIRFWHRQWQTVNQLLDMQRAEIERLREGREDETSIHWVAAQQVVLENSRQTVTAQALLSVDPSQSLDPRLGVQQPDGDPAQPLPYWRRSGV